MTKKWSNYLPLPSNQVKGMPWNESLGIPFLAVREFVWAIITTIIICFIATHFKIWNFESLEF